MTSIKNTLVLLLLSFLISCNSDKKALENHLSQSDENPEKELKINLVVFFINGLDQDVFSLLLEDPNSKNLRDFNQIGFYAPKSYFEDYSDFGANMTAIMSGKSTLNGHLGIDKDSSSNKTWVSDFKEAQYQISIITDKSLGSVVNGAIFTGNQSSFPQTESTVLNMVRFEPDFIWGMETNLFKRRKDGKNLFEELGIKNYNLSFDINNVQIKGAQKFAGVYNNYSLPDSIDLVREGILSWNKIKNKESHVLILNIQGLEDILKSKDKNQLFTLNRYIDLILDTEEFDPKSHLFLIINPFQDFDRKFSISNGDTLEFNSTPLEFNQFNNNIWAFGAQSENFRGFYQNVDLYKKINNIIKN